jgi:hypothetical protein
VIPLELHAKHQFLITANLDSFFDLSQPGDYTVTVRFPIMRARGQAPTNELSPGQASFRIVEKLSAAGAKEKGAWDAKRAETWERFSEAADRARTNQQSTPGK